MENLNKVIVFRYLAREVLLTMFAVSGVLLLIIMSGRFVKYLAEAAAGKLSADVLFAIMGYRIPGFLELVLPLGLFIAILLAYGRLYMENEMTVLSACGMSPKRLLAYTLVPAVFVALIVGSFSLWISPIGVERSEDIFNEQRKRSDFDNMTPARFLPMQGGQAITYAETLSEDRQQMNDVFMAEMGDKESAERGDLAVIVATSGEQKIDGDNQQRYMVLHDGYRYEGRPGSQDYRVVKFERYGQHLAQSTNSSRREVKADSLSTKELWQSDSLENIAALQWRLSLPILVLVVTLLAVPLSHTNPRQGRYVKMIPAILLYIIYLVLLSFARGAVEDGKLSTVVGVWWVHGAFLSIAILLLGWGQWLNLLKPKRSSVSVLPDDSLAGGKPDA